jgi:geranylgeranyl diphosphate synthase, type II
MNSIKNISENNNESLYPSYLVNLINDRLNDYLKDYKDIPEGLFKPINYCLTGGGKRLRPVLCLSTAIGLGCETDHVMPTACAIEFIHNYSLIHDDLPAIDNDDFRRGRLSCHKKFGEASAILAGDALFAEAFGLIIKKQDCSPETKVRLLGEIIEATGLSGMVSGQFVDISTSVSGISKNSLEKMHFDKTARLIDVSVTSAAILCNVKDEIIRKLRTYGQNIGTAFQITDDILDMEDSESDVDVKNKKLVSQEKNTFPYVWGLKMSKKIAEEKVKYALNAIRDIDMDFSLLENIAKFILVRKA